MVLTFIFFISKKRKQTALESQVIHKEQSVIFLFFIIKYIIKQLCVPETRIVMRKNIRLLLTLHASFIDATRVFY